ncbi:xanthine dehydrogenase family protein molybdopterin-binding subunit [Hoeflea sp. WL0058]|uniref:Xanthine dehydrogenase family protein molybdopterin-binding subunit n=1 Tax=Flavimaribacter sediminis TaxID=2865987 RepID=A0AAE3D0C4_9HYPH|nr:xanthine dehydrogenase family protein molybdopterin-binding subunit [Flavimaribacter sediminis]MBW8637524.1 xanthine dehydrogenase family protein molybdopterin-binding subunit [Flavimaribacter sediminis]
MRPDLLEKVSGKAEFISDVSIDGMAFGKVVRSTEPHARIIGMDVSLAEQADGVVCILTGADIDLLTQTDWGLFYEDRPVIARDRVRYVGEPVAVVVADTQAGAEAASRLVAVDYEPLPICATPEQALAGDSPLLHDDFRPISDFYFKGTARGKAGTNVFQDYLLERGDVDSAEHSAHRIFEHSYSFPGIAHFAMEPHCAIARFDHAGLTVWSGAQSPTAVQKVLARVFGLPIARVRVIVPYVGGGFGGKASVKIEPLVAAAARKAGRPVKVLLSAEESMLTCRRLGARITIRTAVDAQGAILSRTGDIVMDGGAYADTGPAVALKSAHRLVGPYRLPNLRIRARAVYTNTVPGAAFRSIGGPQAVWATESHMDEIAAELGEDPVDFRSRHLLQRGDAVIDNLRPLDVDPAVMMDAAVEATTKGHNRASRGLALAVTDPGILPVAGAIVRVHADGSVEVRSMSVEIGQGVRGVLQRIVAETLSQPLEVVHILDPDTASAPYDWGTGASRSSMIMGLAVEKAAEDAVSKLFALASEVFELETTAISLAPGGLDIGDRSVSFRDLFHAAHGIDSGDVMGQASITPRSFDGKLAQAPLFWETAAAACTVSVDPETGVVALDTYAGVADIGRALNRPAAEGQEEGAAVQGLGHALFENLIFDEGQPMTAMPLLYRVPRLSDIPADWTTVLIENGDGLGPMGAKGMGEGGILGMAPAIANALARDHGVRLRDLPMTPERIWTALSARKTHAS